MAACLPLFFAGCIERELVIQSEPPGAHLMLDRDDKGKMPPGGFVERFGHYGTREVVLSMPGYETRTELVTLKRPLYSIVPLDFVFDVLVPFRIRDRHAPPAFALKKLEPETGEFRERAEKIQKSAEEVRRKAEEAIRQTKEDAAPPAAAAPEAPPTAPPSPKPAGDAPKAPDAPEPAAEPKAPAAGSEAPQEKPCPI